MVRKGFVRRRRQANAFLFSAKVGKDEVSGGILGDLAARLFDGSPGAMALNLLETADLDADELRELRELIRRKAKEQA